ncbi:MAG: aldo/keto reductase [Capsulimonadales bacterium]|nr:aldo/keto reductase [Capsulimonadales bacterium]
MNDTPSPMLMQPFGPDNLLVSRIGLGCMGLAGTWNPADVGAEHRRKAIAAFEAALANGITFYDHADIYGGTACESIFKDCLAAVPGSRERIFIATKVGIRSGYYDHSADHIRKSIRGSLDRMGIDYVDLYQLHRPDPLTHPAETAAALDELVEQGLVRYIGVSNYYPQQTLALKRYLKSPIVSNQISISLLRLDPIYEGAAGGAGSVDSAGDGVLDQCLELGITPLAYSPIGAGWLSGKRTVPDDHPRRAQIERILAALTEVGEAYGSATPTQVATAWLLAHPSQIIPLVGSNNPDHIAEAAGAAQIRLSRTDWYKLWVAARGERVP